MKYNPDAYLDYPILRPNSSDYPDGRLVTKLSRTPANKSLNIELAFEVNEPAIGRLIEKGDAVCCALLYCRTTCYSQMLRADPSATVVSASVPLDRLNGRVEIHPSVIATDFTAIRPDTAHPEYEASTIPVDRHRQLAMDEPWHFAVGFVGTIESVFHLQQDESGNLDDGEFEFYADRSERYIIISANSETYRAFQDTRPHVKLTKATVYLNALTTALANLDQDSDDDNERAEGWAATVRAHIEKQNIRWPDSCSHGLAAQKLLSRPLESLSYLSANLQEENS